MWVNFVVICLILFVGIFLSQQYKKSRDSYKVRKRYIIIVSILLILQSGLRNVTVGADTYVYYQYFLEIQTKSWDSIIQNFTNVYTHGIGKDPGYLVFEKVVSIFSDSYQFFLFIIAILFFTALGNFLLKNTQRLNDVILAYIIYAILFYGFFSITGHRQTIATALCLFAFEYIKKRKLISFLIIILIAVTIHKSSLLFIPFYFIAHIKKTKYFNLIILMLFPLFMLNRNIISQYFKTIAGLEEYGEYEAAGTFTFTFLFLLITIVALLRSKIIIHQNHPYAYFAFNAFAIALLFIPLTWVNPSAMRVVQYFSIFMLLLIPQIIHSFSVHSKKIAFDIRVFTIIILIVLMVKVFSNIPPYAFFWEDVQLISH